MPRPAVHIHLVMHITSGALQCWNVQAAPLHPLHPCFKRPRPPMGEVEMGDGSPRAASGGGCKLGEGRMEGGRMGEGSMEGGRPHGGRQHGGREAAWAKVPLLVPRLLGFAVGCEGCRAGMGSPDERQVRMEGAAWGQAAWGEAAWRKAAWAMGVRGLQAGGAQAQRVWAGRRALPSATGCAVGVAGAPADPALPSVPSVPFASSAA